MAMSIHRHACMHTYVMCSSKYCIVTHTGVTRYVHESTIVLMHITQSHNT